MLNKFILILFSLFFFGCSTNAYNIPFVDSVETVALTAGMSRSEVLGVMGQPLYSEYGNRESGEIFWVYEVRGREVKSDILAGSGPSMDNVMEAIPNKTHSIVRPTPPIHRLRLEFRNDKLYRWMPVAGLNNDEGTEEEQQEETTQSSSSSDAPKDTIYVLVVKDNNDSNNQNNSSSQSQPSMKFIDKKSFFIQPQVSLYTLDYTYEKTNNEYPYGTGEDMSGQTEVIYSGLYIGFQNSFGRVGFELGLQQDEGGMFMLRNEKLGITPLELNFNIGVGFAAYNLSDNIDNISDNASSLAFFKFGVGKDIPIIGTQKLIPRLEFIVGEATYKGISISYQF